MSAADFGVGARLTPQAHAKFWYRLSACWGDGFARPGSPVNPMIWANWFVVLGDCANVPTARARAAPLAMPDPAAPAPVALTELGHAPVSVAPPPAPVALAQLAPEASAAPPPASAALVASHEAPAAPAPAPAHGPEEVQKDAIASSPARTVAVPAAEHVFVAPRRAAPTDAIAAFEDPRSADTLDAASRVAAMPAVAPLELEPPANPFNFDDAEARESDAHMVASQASARMPPVDNPGAHARE